MKMRMKDRTEEVGEEAVAGEEDVVEEMEAEEVVGDLEAEATAETGIETAIVTVTVIVGVMATKIEETIVRGIQGITTMIVTEIEGQAMITTEETDEIAMMTEVTAGVSRRHLARS